MNIFSHKIEENITFLNGICVSMFLVMDMNTMHNNLSFIYYFKHG